MGTDGGRIPDSPPRSPLAIVGEGGKDKGEDLAEESTGPEVYPATTRIGSALAYAFTSIGIVWANKITLTVYAFPSASVLALSQIFCVVVFIGGSRCFFDFGIKPFGWKPLMAIMPLPPVQLVNVVAGLVGTKYVSLPMFSALRHFGLILTLIAESYFFGTTRGAGQIGSLVLICVGALVAAFTDLTYNPLGYMAVGINNLATTSVGILNKQKSDKGTALGGGLWGVLFYNNILFLPMMVAFIFAFKYEEATQAMAFGLWTQPGFLISFFLSSVLGFFLQATILWSTKVNGPLTTAVVGCMKGVMSSYGGMAMPDFHFELWHFIGINISIVGALFYSGIEIYDKKDKKEAAIESPKVVVVGGTLATPSPARS